MAKRLDTPVHADQFIQAHTPFREEVKDLADKNVLVLGSVGNASREVTEYYSYKKVVTTADLITTYPDLFPFNEMHGDYFKDTARPIEKDLAIAAIFHLLFTKRLGSRLTESN